MNVNEIRKRADKNSLHQQQIEHCAYGYCPSTSNLLLSTTSQPQLNVTVPTTTANCSKTSNGTLREDVHRLYQDTATFKMSLSYHGTRTTVISFMSKPTVYHQIHTRATAL